MCTKTIAQLAYVQFYSPGNTFLSTQLGTFPPEINPGKRQRLVTLFDMCVNQHVDEFKTFQIRLLEWLMDFPSFFMMKQPNLIWRCDGRCNALQNEEVQRVCKELMDL